MSTSDIQQLFQTMDYGPAPESREEADRWLDKYQRQFDLFIDNQWGKTKEYFTSNNPATGESLANIAKANAEDVDRAVRAAKQALPTWIAIGPHGRARYLYAIARQIQKHARLFAVLESLDNGKPIRESRDIDIPLVTRHFYHHAGWAQLMETEMSDYQPIGVIGQIIPWNFPLLMLAWKIAPALAMGNTVVLKPAEFTSITAMLFAEICQQIGLPPGVVNIVTGFGETGAAIVNHSDVQKIAFTGSTEVGRIIRRATAGTQKKLSLELGGKSPFIVFSDADLDSAVEGLIDAIWFNQGQVCCAGSRLLVHESIAESFIDKIKVRLEHYRLGDPLDKSVDMGAIICPSQLETIQRIVAQGEKEGAMKWQPNWAKGNPRVEAGCFYPPTLFTNISPANTVAQCEIFGPVLVTMTFRTPAEAIQLANNTRYGLGASVWTENINLALDMAPAIKAGVVWINSTNLFDASAGFGGYRESGFGREGGKEGLYEYVKPIWESTLPVVDGNESLLKQQQPKKLKSQQPDIDVTAKLYIGGKQVRPDGGYSMAVYNTKGVYITEIAKGNHKDIRNAVEAAHKGISWASKKAHQRAQVLYYIAENLSHRAEEITHKIMEYTGVTASSAREEVALCISRLFTYAAYADKYDGHIHQVPLRNVTLAMPEALGVVGLVCPNEVGLIGFISTLAPLIAMGNCVIAVPSARYPLLATDFYQILETSDLPAGVVNIVTGPRDSLTEALATHDDVDGIWYFGSSQGSQLVEAASADNMKRTWVNNGKQLNWLHTTQTQGQDFLRLATQIKNIWVPYGE